MNDHVAKPIDPDGLFGALAKWIRPREGLPADAPVPRPIAESDAAAVGAQAPQPADDTETDALKAIPGLDVDAGLKRLMGKRDFYERMLRQFTTGEESQAVATIRARLAEGDRDTAERTAHSLKGVAGTLGATELQARAGELERPGAGHRCRPARGSGTTRSLCCAF